MRTSKLLPAECREEIRARIRILTEHKNWQKKELVALKWVLNEEE